MNQLQQQQINRDILQEAKDYVTENPNDITLETFKRNVIRYINDYTLFYILKQYNIRVSEFTKKSIMTKKLREFLFDEIIRDKQVMNSFFNNQSISLDFKVDFINNNRRVHCYNIDVYKKIASNLRQQLYETARNMLNQEEAEEYIRKYEEKYGVITL